MSELPKTYDPKSVEDKLYKFWVDSGFFHAEVNPDKKPYTIVIPPPNVTGQLHMGHAFDETLQDILIRTKRMQGYEALWMPGTDHAGIATQIKVEENLRKEEGLTRYDLGREEFLKRVWAWKDKFGSRIISQLKKLGTSCDWDRERFTMDEGCSKAVREVFVNLYNKGLIYKGHRIINWCPHCATALSDAEVEYETQPGKLWHIRYPLADGSGELVVATTRPETFMGDTGVAVNPNDERYKHLIGKTCILPIMNREIPIFGDEYVDMEFGTGCVKVTPCHDPNDFEMGQRHDLEQILVFNEDATVNANGGKYEGMDRYECRKAVVKDLEEGGWLVKIEDHEHNVGTCYRCGTTVEPMTSAQWFVKMAPLAKPAMDVVNEGKTKFVPDRFSKTYLRWMENVHDWCISRQLWWGHRIPAFYCEDCGEMTVSKTDVCTCPKCGGTHIHQEEDVLDTWFSSALWPFSTLGWPDKTKELDYFYPTSTLVTGYDIIFFWVARMIFSGVEHMGETPFKTVYIHGLVRDAQGRKMSKSLGNGIDPLEVIDQYGADALRFTLATGNSPGNDMRFSDERVQASRNFCNKIWNASRFIQMNLTIDKDKAVELPSDLAIEDKWIISKFNTLVADVTRNIDQYELGLAAAKLNDFIWENFCDWYIEIAKTRLQTGDENVQKVLCYVLSGAMQLLHPFMPFITETIWQALPHEGPSVMVSAWPEYKDELHFAAEEAQMESLMDAVRAIRNRRAEMNVPPSKKAKVLILTEKKDTFSAGAGFFPKLAYASEIELIDAVPADAAKMASVVTGDAQIYMPMGDLIDFEAERARLGKEKSKVEADIDFVMKKLNNPKFVDKAPEKVVAAEREKAEKLREHLAKLEESIAALN
ncbi:valine--tRNA ligase [Butyricicoccus sp. AF22-28AC]|nr:MULTISPECIES: valine--tRNA ligase [unclassified Butyricicoccus]RGM78534.1 valine--tRNA ligase [Butyricicoccus sp. OM06-6AC]RHQ74401.1 valine--tRNA ligase [Butyricicoccus sp. AF24-19AC]RHQ81601.1 valine--tRNA ligase [Butyricicoccus sp. AF22-28AC]RHR87027.1 valine--tRNA ligase [Butyricicoccus sp. AF15-40]